MDDIQKSKFINLCVLLFAVGIIIGINYGDEKYIIPLGMAVIIVTVCSIVLMYKQSRLAIAVVALLFFLFLEIFGVILLCIFLQRIFQTGMVGRSL